MKKIICAVLTAIIALMALSSCGSRENEYTLGIGGSAEAKTANLTLVETVAAVVLDREGKIILCRVDSVDARAVYLDGAIEKKSYKSKAELGDSYGMLSPGGSDLAEWDDQARFFEDYVVGKTIDEVKGIKSGEGELASGCTIDVSPFIKAIGAAVSSERKTVFKAKGDITLGVAIDCSVSDKGGSAAYTANMSASVINDGKIAAALIDSRESTIIAEEGVGVEYKPSKTKLELGDEYNMVEYGGASAEWYVQAKTYADSAVGKTKSELSGLATEGVAGCTIGVEDYKKVLILASERAR
ncbi:MAG: hypothetical protein E7641_01015 [Ruminococcaceae bacterium]|nr:hypothetical protein [Oscillospiraceae bacterium]